jgi:DNA polymerase-4
MPSAGKRKHKKSGKSELDSALDQVKDKFGTNAITRGILLGRRTAPDMPLLPD